MSNQSLTFCPLCTHPRRRELDSEITYWIDQGKAEPDILRGLAVFCADKEISLVLNEKVLSEHLKKHPLVGVIGVANVRGGGSIRLPSGEKIDVNDTKSVLRTLLVMGMANAMTHPEDITIGRLLRVAELLMRPDPHQKDDDMEELKALILGKMRQSPPPQLDTVQNPYAAPSNVGKLQET